MSQFIDYRGRNVVQLTTLISHTRARARTHTHTHTHTHLYT